MSRKSYNDEFKIAAAKLAREPGCSIRKAATSLGVDEGSIRDWVRKFAPAGPEHHENSLMGRRKVVGEPNFW